MGRLPLTRFIAWPAVCDASITPICWKKDLAVRGAGTPRLDSIKADDWSWQSIQALISVHSGSFQKQLMRLAELKRSCDVAQTQSNIPGTRAGDSGCIQHSRLHWRLKENVPTGAVFAIQRSSGWLDSKKNPVLLIQHKVEGGGA